MTNSGEGIWHKSPGVPGRGVYVSFEPLQKKCLSPPEITG